MAKHLFTESKKLSVEVLEIFVIIMEKNRKESNLFAKYNTLSEYMAVTLIMDVNFGIVSIPKTLSEKMIKPMRYRYNIKPINPIKKL